VIKGENAMITMRATIVVIAFAIIALSVARRTGQMALRGGSVPLAFTMVLFFWAMLGVITAILATYL
jgi:hypothetical protein